MFKSFVLGMIRFYQKGISPFTLPSCRYVPTCSAYAVEAIERHGALRGGWMAARRIGRCHPFGGKGHDPVPAPPGCDPEEGAEFRAADPVPEGHARPSAPDE